MTIEITRITEQLLIAKAKRLNLEPQVLANRILYLILTKSPQNMGENMVNLSDQDILNVKEESIETP